MGLNRGLDLDRETGRAQPGIEGGKGREPLQAPDDAADGSRTRRAARMPATDSMAAPKLPQFTGKKIAPGR
jgi:hypothetical protein